VLLRRRAAGERAEIAPPAALRIYFPRIEPVLAGRELANHDGLSRIGWSLCAFPQNAPMRLVPRAFIRDTSPPKLERRPYEGTNGVNVFRSNEEFFTALRTLIDRLCDERRLKPLARILPGYLAFNGLTDGWHELINALKAARGLGPDEFNPADWGILNDLVHAAELAVSSRN
jgi:hypothetical protein